MDDLGSRRPLEVPRVRGADSREGIFADLQIHKLEDSKVASLSYVELAMISDFSQRRFEFLLSISGILEGLG